jgi:hypothetical protein
MYLYYQIKLTAVKKKNALSRFFGGVVRGYQALAWQFQAKSASGAAEPEYAVTSRNGRDEDVSAAQRAYLLVRWVTKQEGPIPIGSA